jgi:hypothetical protein
MTFQNFEKDSNIGNWNWPKPKVYKHTKRSYITIKQLKMENSFDINNLIRRM